MYPRKMLRIAAILATTAVLVLSLRQSFGDAWLSGYTYAYNPTAAPQPSVKTPETLQQPASEPETVPKPPRPKPVALSNRIAEYHMDVHLHDKDKKLHGTQSITWKNPGQTTVSELYFHLYPNAFMNKNTTFMRESGGRLREDRATTDSVGYMKLNALTLENGTSLLPALQYVRPDDNNPNDMTLARIRLPEPVAPGNKVTLKTAFEVKLPEVFARMGYSGDFIMAGQWFPKLAAYETAGTRGSTKDGWNLHQYHGNSEFYSDFGIYNVRIQVPSRYKVAATGFPTKSPVISGGNKIYHFYADDVHDFAWSASPDFVYVEEAFSAPGVPGVRIKLYLDPLHAHLKERYMHAAKSSLAKYAHWYGDYPYSTLSVIVPPKGGNGAGGMEYPTLVTAFAAESESPGYSLERTVVHEIGHQFWYGMVASNEFEEAWLDEGFTSYAEDKVMEAVYGVESNLPIESSYMTSPAPLKQHSWHYDNNDHYAENVYMRAKLVLLGIEQQVGEAKMQAILRAYFKSFKFRHPSTEDFQAILEKVTGRPWGDYFKAFVYGSEMSDVAVDSIQVKPVKKDGKKQYESVVLIRREGGSLGPVAVILQFADGTTMPRVWDGNGTEIEYRLNHDTPLSWVVADPNLTNILDNKRINNFMKAELPAKERNRWNMGLVKLVELMLSRIGW